MKKIIFTTTVFTLIVCGFSHAGIIKEVESDEKCSTTSVQITGITAVAAAGGNIVPANKVIDSTSCLGFVTYPDNDWGNNPKPNMGGLGDGLLNSEAVLKGQGQDKDSYYVPGDYFLTNDRDSMVNLDGIGEANDPGWIRLGGAETTSGGEWNFKYDSIGNYNLGSVIDMSFIDNGTWSLAVDPSAIEFVTKALGRPSVFDHLAFVMKGPNSGGNDDGSWAIYDFNFYDLIDDDKLNISFGDTTYKFEGTWDKDMFIKNNALSHMSVWAHDPPVAQDVPEPSTLAIFVLGIIGLVSRRFNKHL
ncbi:PEP-CTERM sorting domain-containing protein [Colwellia sp. MB02u-6]|uniref:PEP-CTERM sorting domain-containing protein n=1 Tax=Colwellia sp. MB02u-6 TaxID=2759824 RepID=UPI0015F71B2B|nr:PEP-CTERM sorting domain-containing protein [Colwellia sp. MB02u-6]MBA6329355.1 PEP-CTERM sorting domain-containing protein [Colwellia sp. MB02u-6]